MRLDERARTASASLRSGVTELTPPDLDATIARRRRSRLLAVAGVVIMLVAGAALALRPDSDSTGIVDDIDRDATEVGGGLTYYEVTPPEGFTMESAYDLPFDDDLPPIGRIQLYGDPSGDDPFATGDLSIGVVELSDAVSMSEAPTSEPVEVRGTTGSIVDADTGTGSVVMWTEDAVVIAVASRSRSRAELLSIAEGLDVSGVRVRLGPGVGDVELIADHEFGAVFGIGTGSGWLQTFVRGPGESGDPAAFFTVVATSLQPWAFETARYLIPGFGEDVEVRGTTGYRGPTSPDVDGEHLVWVENDRVVITITNVSGADVMAIAESLAPIDEHRWDELKASARFQPASPDDDRGTPDEGGTVVDSRSERAGTVDGPDGELIWRLTLVDEDLCFFTRFGIEGASDCGLAAEAPIAVESEFEHDVWLSVFGRVEPGVVRVEASLDDGGTEELEVFELGDAAVPVFVRVWRVDTEARPVSVTAYDADGLVLGATPVTD